MKHLIIGTFFLLIPIILLAQPPRARDLNRNQPPRRPTMLMECRMVEQPFQRGRGQRGPLDMGNTISPAQRQAMEKARRQFQQTMDSIMRESKR